MPLSLPYKVYKAMVPSSLAAGFTVPVAPDSGQGAAGRADRATAAPIVKRFRPRRWYGIVCLMDSPSFLTGGSAPDAHAAEPTTARPAPDVVLTPSRSPAPWPARPLASAPPAAPVRAARSAVARSVPALDDDTPVDNLPSEKQQRLLTEPLYSSCAGPGGGRPLPRSD